MSNPRSIQSDLVQWLAGFLGAMLVVAVVPRAVRFVTRRILGKFLIETVLFAVVGVLFERGFELIDRK